MRLDRLLSVSQPIRVFWNCTKIQDHPEAGLPPLRPGFCLWKKTSSFSVAPGASLHTELQKTLLVFTNLFIFFTLLSNLKICTTFFSNLKKAAKSQNITSNDQINEAFISFVFPDTTFKHQMSACWLPITPQEPAGPSWPKLFSLSGQIVNKCLLLHHLHVTTLRSGSFFVLFLPSPQVGAGAIRAVHRLFTHLSCSISMRAEQRRWDPPNLPG